MKKSPQSISLALFVTSVIAGLLSWIYALNEPAIALALAYFTFPVLLFRAFVEWKNRPVDQLARSLAWGALIAVIFSVIVPAWANARLAVLPWVAIPVILNCMVPIGRTAVLLVQRFTQARG